MNRFETELYNFLNKSTIKPFIIIFIIFYGRYIFDYVIIKNKYIYLLLFYFILKIYNFSNIESFVLITILMTILNNIENLPKGWLTDDKLFGCNDRIIYIDTKKNSLILNKDTKQFIFENPVSNFNKIKKNDIIKFTGSNKYDIYSKIDEKNNDKNYNVKTMIIIKY